MIYTRILAIIVTSLVLMLSTLSQAEDVEIRLEGEGNGDLVKLKWIPKGWTEELKGVVIKRRSIDGEKTSPWVAVHDGVIIPSLVPNKDFKQLESSLEDRARLQEKLKDLYENRGAKNLPEKEFREFILLNPRMRKTLPLGFVTDYDLAIMHGLGLVDRDIPQGKVYEYGLFLKYQGKELATSPVSQYTWKWGDKVDLAVEAETKIKQAYRNGKQAVTVIWEVHTQILKDKGIPGFRIYKKSKGSDYKQVKNLVFVSTSNEKEELGYKDSMPNDMDKMYYAAAPVSRFGTEGELIEIKAEQKYFDVYLPGISPRLSVTKGNVSVIWKAMVQEENEVYIKSFSVLRKRDSDSDFVVVAENLPAMTREYTDSSIKESGNYTYRVDIHKHDGSITEGHVESKQYTK